MARKAIREDLPCNPGFPMNANKGPGLASNCQECLGAWGGAGMSTIFATPVKDR